MKAKNKAKTRNLTIEQQMKQLNEKLQASQNYMMQSISNFNDAMKIVCKILYYEKQENKGRQAYITRQAAVITGLFRSFFITENSYKAVHLSIVKMLAEGTISAREEPDGNWHINLHSISLTQFIRLLIKELPQVVYSNGFVNAKTKTLFCKTLGTMILINDCSTGHNSIRTILNRL